MQNNLNDRPRFRSVQTKHTDSWWVNRLKEHPVKATSISALVFGGVMLITFLSYLQELPDLDLAGSASLLWALAVIGGLMFLLGVIAMLPGAYAKVEPGAWRQSTFHIVLLSMPALVWLIILASDMHPEPTGAPFLVLLFVLGVIIIGVRYRQIVKQTSAASETAPSITELSLDMFAGMLAWGVTLALSLLFAIRINAQGELDGWPLICAQVAFVYGIAIVAAKLDWSKQPAMLFVLAAATITIPILLSGNITAIGVASVRFLGLGERPSRLVVSAAGCDILNKAAGRTVCEVHGSDKTAVVCPAILKSRIGTPYFIELSPLGENGRWPERRRHPLVPLAKGEVLSWPKLDLSGQMPENTATPATAASQSAAGASAAAPSLAQPTKRYLTYWTRVGCCHLRQLGCAVNAASRQSALHPGRGAQCGGLGDQARSSASDFSASTRRGRAAHAKTAKAADADRPPLRTGTRRRKVNLSATHSTGAPIQRPPHALRRARQDRPF